MKIKGLHQRNITDFHSCEMLIERGKLYRILVENSSPISAFAFSPKTELGFDIDKIPSETSNIVPYDCNYVLEYIGKNDESQKIYFKLNHLETIKIKWASKKYIIQSKEIKSDILKYLIGAIIGTIFTVLTQHYFL